MSRDMLRRLAAGNAFKPHPTRVDLGRYHVPFDTLTGSLGCEHQLSEALRHDTQVALVAGVGGGKSSVIEAVLNPAGHGVTGDPHRRYFPVVLPIAMDSPDAAVDATSFIHYLVRTLGTRSNQGFPDNPELRRTAEDLTRAKRHRRRRFSASPSIASPEVAQLKLETSLEIEQLMEDLPKSSRDLLDVAVDVLRVIRDREGLQPVLIFDDTDTWLATEYQTHRERFFRTLPKLLSEELGVATVFAVQPQYQADEAYLRASREFFHTEVLIPPLPASRSVGRILERRLQLSGEDAALDQVVTPAALDRVHAVYQAGERSVRSDVLVLMAAALVEAVDADHDVITERAVELASS